MILCPFHLDHSVTGLHIVYTSIDEDRRITTSTHFDMRQSTKPMNSHFETDCSYCCCFILNIPGFSQANKNWVNIPMKFLDVLMRMTVGGQFVLKPTGSLSDFGQVEFLHCKKVETCNCYFKKLVPQYLTKKKKKKFC